jgi:hypothetical protein
LNFAPQLIGIGEKLSEATNAAELPLGGGLGQTIEGDRELANADPDRGHSQQYFSARDRH